MKQQSNNNKLVYFKNEKNKYIMKFKIYKIKLKAIMIKTIYYKQIFNKIKIKSINYKMILILEVKILKT